MRVIRKNISRVLHDVRPPSHFTPKAPRAVLAISKQPARILPVQTAASAIAEVIPRPKSAPTPEQFKRQPRQAGAPYSTRKGVRNGLLYTFIGVVLLVVFSYAVSLYGIKDTTLQAFYGMQESLERSLQAFQNLDTDKAGASLKDGERELTKLKSTLERRGLYQVSSWLSGLFPTVRAMRLTIDTLQVLIGHASELHELIEELQRSAFSYFMGGDGGRLITLIGSIREHADGVITAGEKLQNLRVSLTNSILARYIDPGSGGNDLAALTEGYATLDFIDGILKILDNKTSAHFLILFQNPSEIRPSGGFVGSYAVITVKDGALVELDVRDIYDPDGWVETKKVPPKPLQVTTIDWEARDANWFLDFRTSAAKVIERLEDSSFYREKNITFDGAVALNTNVVEGLLNFTGPIELPDYGLVIDAENFLEEVQYEVEAGDNKAKNQPKKILQDLTPELLARLKDLDDTKKEKLFAALGEHLSQKDIQIYFTESDLRQSMEKYGIGGAVFEIPQSWNGDYLAVVNANVAAGKTDAYITQSIALDSRIDSTGTVTNKVTVERAHAGGRTKYSWYNVTNKNFMRLLTPKDSKLQEIKNETERVVRAPIDYAKSGYAVDSDIKLLESEGRESGKNVFSAWRYTDPGKTSTITFSYERIAALNPKDGATYQFVFDKQSGVTGGITYTLHAPPGFRFAESGKSIFEYANENPPARITLDLTLEEI